MELSKKTTILFTPDLHDHLSRVAAERGTSLGALVREACRSVYGEVTTEERLAAVRELAKLELPVASVEEMERESVPAEDSLLP